MSIFGSDTLGSQTEQQQLDAKCIAEAKDLGILKNDGSLHEDFVIYDVDAVLPMTEGLQNKIVRVKRTKAQQMNRLVKRQVLTIASLKNDPNFAKWRKFMDLARKYRMQMNKKYQQKAKMDVRKIISGARNAALGKAAIDLDKK